MWRTRRHRELDEEIEAHLRMAIHDRMERGETAEQARSNALREFGNTALVKETTRDSWGWTAVEQFLQELRGVVRVLTKAPAFSAAVILLVALGIGVNTTIYSAIHGILTRPRPGVRAGRLVSMGVTIRGRSDDPGNSYPNYRDYVQQSRTLRPILARGFDRFTLALKDGSYGYRGCRVTANYFDTAGVVMAKGRSFSEDEDRSDAAGLTAVISYRLWQDRFVSAADIAGRSIELNGYPATVVGVAPPQFRGVQIAEDMDVWVPIRSYARISGTERRLFDRTDREVELSGSLVPGATLAQARAEFDTISTRLAAADSKADGVLGVELEPYSALGPGVQRIRVFMGILLAVALLGLVIVCANVANLMLARSAARQREMAVRQSIGASRGRILRLLLAESIVLSATAWAAAYLMAQWASRALPRLIPARPGAAIQLDLSPDWRVAVFAMILASLSALAFTLAPALSAWRQQLLPWLKAGEHGVVQGRSRLASCLVVVQLALCVVLLTSAGLAYRSLYLIDTTNTQRSGGRLLLVDVETAGAAPTHAQNLALLERLEARLRAIPGVTAASFARTVPPNWWSRLRVQSPGSRESLRVETNLAGPDCLRTFGNAILAGRDFNSQDRAGGPPVVIVNQDLAAALWPGRPALGQTLLIGDDRRAAEVVGVTANGFFTNSQPAAPHNFLFLPEAQGAARAGEITLFVRHDIPAASVAPAIRAAVRETDSRVPIFTLRSMEAQMENFTGPVLAIASLLGVFAVAALLLASIGLYAVIAFHLSRRTRDFGIRMALGASSQQVLRGILREGLMLTTIGLVLGFLLSAASGNALRGILFGVTPTDAVTYAGVFVLLSVVSLLACYLPARRAAGIDPTVALRQE